MMHWNWSWAKRGLALALCAVCLAGLSGCGGDAKKEEPTEEKAAPPPPPSVDQLFNELNQAFTPISSAVIPGGEMEMVMAAVNNFKQAYSKVNGQRTTNPNADTAILKMKPVVEQTIKLAKERDRQRFIKGSILCYQVLEPADKKYDALLAKTEILLNMPGVKLRGFTTVDTDVYAFFEIFDPKTYAHTTAKVREGEEFYNGRFQFIRIIGNQESAEILYKEADYALKLGGPRQRVQSSKPAAE